MAIAGQMTDQQRKAVALEYLKAFDNGGVRENGGSILELFAPDAQVYFPKWGVARGRDEIGRMFGDVGATLKSILHDYDRFNYVMTGTDTFAVEGTSIGEHRDGPWKAGEPEHGAGRWCDVFEVRDGLIQRCFIYLDPDYAGRDTARYPVAREGLSPIVQPFVYDALPGRVVFANGAFDRVPDELDRLGVLRILLIADRSGLSWADRLALALGPKLAGRIDDVRAHVPIEHAEAARAMAREQAADCIVTIGGGSATGLGKAIALVLPLPILAVPTTYAGSEMTPIWGLTEGARKQTGRDPRVQPRTVVYDPVLTLSLPAAVAGPSGMNALAHCAEALYAAGASPITSLMAVEGIRILASGLPRVVATPDDLDARGDVLAGAYLAAAAFASAGSGIHHKICHVLGGAYDLPHAEMHTVILPHALALVAPAEPEAIARIGASLGNPDVPAAVYDLAVTLGAPTSLQTIGMPPERLDEAARLIVEAVPGNPKPVDEPAIRALLADAFEGRRPSLDPVVGRSTHG